MSHISIRIALDADDPEVFLDCLVCGALIVLDGLDESLSEQVAAFQTSHAACGPRWNPPAAPDWISAGVRDQKPAPAMSGYVVGTEVGGGRMPLAHAVLDTGAATATKSAARCGYPSNHLTLMSGLHWDDVAPNQRCPDCLAAAVGRPPTI